MSCSGRYSADFALESKSVSRETCKHDAAHHDVHSFDVSRETYVDITY